jgi:hypothetical protein
LAEAIGSIDTFEEARMALDLIEGQLTEPLDQQFAQSLWRQIDVLERIRNREKVA